MTEIAQYLGGFLRAAFIDLEEQELPRQFRELLDMLDLIPSMGETPLPAETALSDEEFKKALTQAIPRLRSFARAMSGSADLADDLVQQTMMKAWAGRARFRAGTSFPAWTHTILRNEYLTRVRRNRFTAEWSDAVAERILVAPAVQDKGLELADLNRAMAQLPAAQREALLLTGPGGFSYEEAAAICNCAVGTIKSRVFRARGAIEDMLEGGKLPMRRLDTDQRPALEQMMEAAESLSANA